MLQFLGIHKFSIMSHSNKSVDGFHHEWLHIDGVRIALGGVASVTYQVKLTISSLDINSYF